MDESGTMATVARAFNVVGFAGSLRRGSYNRALLRTATELAPSALHIVIHERLRVPRIVKLPLRFFEFDSFEAAKPFTISYRLVAKNLRAPKEGELHVKINRRA